MERESAPWKNLLNILDRVSLREYTSRIVKKLSKKGRLLKMGNRIIWRKNFESNNRYVITDSNSDDGLVSDFITYSEIIEKLNERIVDFDDIEIIEEIDICELEGGESSGSKKRDYENDNNFNLKRWKISDATHGKIVLIIFDQTQTINVTFNDGEVRAIKIDAPGAVLLKEDVFFQISRKLTISNKDNPINVDNDTTSTEDELVDDIH
ncbi:1704_t:CDS:2, partial [Acaulospora morrowiae]